MPNWTGEPGEDYMPCNHSGRHTAGAADEIRIDQLGAALDSTAGDTSTSAHGLCPKLPGGTSTFFRGDGVFAAPQGVGGSSPKQAVINFGTLAVRSASITVNDAAVTAGSKIVAVQSDLSDTEENSGDMDLLSLSVRPGNGSFTVFASGPTPVRGPFTINYFL